MKDIILSAVVLALLSITVRTVLPRISIFVKWLIKTFVHFAEKKIKGSGLGKQKKAKVLKWLRWFGVHSSSFVDDLIENTVEIMNNKKVEMKDEITNDIVGGINKTTTKIIDKIK
jgi:hypothetical protein